jgi:hypothetical protein
MPAFRPIHPPTRVPDSLNLNVHWMPTSGRPCPRLLFAHLACWVGWASQEVAPSTLLDLHVVTSQQLESTYGTTTEAVLLTDQAHRQLWANTEYDTLLASYTHADARPQAVSLSCYAYHDPASVECR